MNEIAARQHLKRRCHTIDISATPLHSGHLGLPLTLWTCINHLTLSSLISSPVTMRKFSLGDLLGCFWASLVAQPAKSPLLCGRPGFEAWVGKIPWRRERLPSPVFRPGEFHGLYSPWSHKESDRTERLSLSVYLRDILMCLDVKLIQYESYYSVFYPFFNIVLWISFSVKTIGFLKIIQLALLLQIWAQFFFILTFIIEIAKKLVFYFFNL